jgi:hypothetical protein
MTEKTETRREINASPFISPHISKLYHTRLYLNFSVRWSIHIAGMRDEKQKSGARIQNPE